MKGYEPLQRNAMMKASIQTSIYKLMLMELGIQTGQTAVFYVENSMGNYSVEELAHMDRLRYKPKNITKRVNRCFSRTLAAFYSSRYTCYYYGYFCIRILNNLCFKPLEEKTLMQ
jgi:hypothetical protein